MPRALAPVCGLCRRPRASERSLPAASPLLPARCTHRPHRTPLPRGSRVGQGKAGDPVITPCPHGNPSLHAPAISREGRYAAPRFQDHRRDGRAAHTPRRTCVQSSMPSLVRVLTCRARPRLMIRCGCSASAFSRMDTRWWRFRRTVQSPGPTSSGPNISTVMTSPTTRTNFTCVGKRW